MKEKPPLTTKELLQGFCECRDIYEYCYDLSAEELFTIYNEEDHRGDLMENINFTCLVDLLGVVPTDGLAEFNRLVEELTSHRAQEIIVEMEERAANVKNNG